MHYLLFVFWLFVIQSSIDLFSSNNVVHSLRSDNNHVKKDLEIWNQRPVNLKQLQKHNPIGIMRQRGFSGLPWKPMSTPSRMLYFFPTLSMIFPNSKQLYQEATQLKKYYKCKENNRDCWYWTVTWTTRWTRPTTTEKPETTSREPLRTTTTTITTRATKTRSCGYPWLKSNCKSS